MSRGMTPGLKAWMDYKKYIGNKIKNAGPVASIVAKKYLIKVKDVTDKIAAYAEAKKIFDKDQANWDTMVSKAKSEFAASRKRKN